MYYGLSVQGASGSEVIQINPITYNSQSGIYSNISSSYTITSSYTLTIVPSTWSQLSPITNGITGSVTWNCVQNVYEDRKILQMSASNYLSMSISGLYNGWQGALQTIQSGSLTASLLSISPIPKVVNNGMGQVYLTSGSGAIDIIKLSYNGNNLFVNYNNHFN